MYVKPPSGYRSGMKLPENYSGSAFSRQASYIDMPPPARMQTQRQEPTTSYPRIERDIPIEDIKQDFVPPPPQYYEKEEEKTEAPLTEAETADTGSSIFSSLLPKADLSSHFPFGHGIGSEELLILAVMLMVFLSGNDGGEVDSEFILLLGLLLFAG